MKAHTINPALIPALFEELSMEQRAHVRRCLGHVPGVYDGDDCVLWTKFQNRELSLLTMQDDAGQIVAGVFFGVETVADGTSDCCICSGFSFVPQQDISVTSFPQIEAIAKAAGCQSVSLRTTRPGLVAKLIEQGWFASEIIVRKPL